MTLKLLLGLLLFLTSTYFASSKIYDRCELAKELKYVHGFEPSDIATWICITQHESHFNTSARNPGSGDHGLFQISQQYWCSPPGNGFACNSPCAKFRDDDITDDVKCVKKIFKERQRISGNGFNAWAVYPLYCRGDVSAYVSDCFDKEIDNAINTVEEKEPEEPVDEDGDGYDFPPLPTYSKVYDRCELARELKSVHRIPEEQISTWVCIAQHESNFVTSAMNRGSGDHGLFQISDQYWCSLNDVGNTCNAKCSSFRDSNISDDVRCIRTIYNEHTRISGDGFNAWVVYPRYCKGDTSQYVEGCFEREGKGHVYKPPPSLATPRRYEDNLVVAENKPKIYRRCELAQELRNIYRFPDEQISKWVCIAQHESNYDTSAMNIGSGDHGLFQISDQYWCSLEGRGNGCNAHCASFRDADISDDVQCIRTIYNEHTRISGDGFNAWVVYPKYCSGDTSPYIQGCLDTVIKTDNFLKKPEDNLILKFNKPKIYDRCELAQELRKLYGFPEQYISKWICIVQHESNFDTSAMNPGSGDHGLFQISEQYWCSVDGVGKGCNAHCGSFRDDNLSDDVECVRTIFNEHTAISGDGFNAWVVYPRYCKGDTSAYVNGCFETEFSNDIYEPLDSVINKIEDTKVHENYPENSIFQSSTEKTAYQQQTTKHSKLTTTDKSTYQYPTTTISSSSVNFIHSSSKITTPLLTSTRKPIKKSVMTTPYSAVTLSPLNFTNKIEFKMGSNYLETSTVKPNTEKTLYQQSTTEKYTNQKLKFANFEITTPSPISARQPFSSSKAVLTTAQATVTQSPLVSSHTSTVQSSTGKREYEQTTKHLNRPTTKKYVYQYPAIKKSSQLLNHISTDFKVTTPSVSTQNSYSAIQSTLTTAKSTATPLSSISAQPFTLKTVKPIISEFSATAQKSTLTTAYSPTTPVPFTFTPKPILITKNSISFMEHPTTKIYNPVTTQTASTSEDLSSSYRVFNIFKLFSTVKPSLANSISEQAGLNRKSLSKSLIKDDGVSNTSKLDTNNTSLQGSKQIHFRPTEETLLVKSASPVRQRPPRPTRFRPMRPGNVAYGTHAPRPLPPGPARPVVTFSPTSTSQPVATSVYSTTSIYQKEKDTKILKPPTSIELKTSTSTPTENKTAFAFNKPLHQEIFNLTGDSKYSFKSLISSSTTEKEFSTSQQISTASTIAAYLQENIKTTTDNVNKQDLSAAKENSVGSGFLLRQGLKPIRPKPPILENRNSSKPPFALPRPIPGGSGPFPLQLLASTKPPTDEKDHGPLLGGSFPLKPWSKPLGPRPMLQDLIQNISKPAQGISRPQGVQNIHRPMTGFQRPSRPTVLGQPATSVYSATSKYEKSSSSSTTETSNTNFESTLNGSVRTRPRPPFPNAPRPIVTLRPTSTNQPVATSVYVTTPKYQYEKKSEKLFDNLPLTFINSGLNKGAKPVEKSLNIFPGYSFSRTRTGGPVFLSFPHLLYTDEEYTKTLVGLHPEPDKHETYITLEPISGFPLDLAQRVQFNMFLRPIEGFDLMENVTSSLIPLMWVEESTTLEDKYVDMLKSKLINNLHLLDILIWVVIGSGAACVLLAIFLLVYVEEP